MIDAASQSLYGESYPITPGRRRRRGYGRSAAPLTEQQQITVRHQRRGRFGRADSDYATLQSVVALATSFDAWNHRLRLPPKQIKHMVMEAGQVIA